MSPTRHVTWFKTHWFVSILLALTSLVIILYLTGLTIPKEHVATSSREFQSSQHDVWMVLSDFSNWPEWRSDLQEIRLGHNGFTEVLKSGESIDYRIEDFTTPERIVIRIATEGLPYGGSWTFELTSAGNGCRVTITETGEVYNPIFRVISKYFIGQTASMERCLEDLSKKIN